MKRSGSLACLKKIIIAHTQSGHGADAVWGFYLPTAQMIQLVETLI